MDIKIEDVETSMLEEFAEESRKSLEKLEAQLAKVKPFPDALPLEQQAFTRFINETTARIDSTRSTISKLEQILKERAGN